MQVVHVAHDETERARLLAAAEAARTARPPGIVRVVAVDDTSDALRVTVEAPEGPRLEGTKVERPALAAVAGALAALHAQGVAHGDVRPATIMIDATGRAVLPLPRWQGCPPTIADDVAALAALTGDADATSAAALALTLANETLRLLGNRRGSRPRASRTKVAGAVAIGAGVVVMATALALPTRAPSVAPAPTTVPTPSTVPAAAGAVVELGGRRYVAGDEGDLVLVGAWHCDGTLRPAVVRPRTGEVFVYDRVGPGATATAVTRLEGVTAAGRAGGHEPGCDRLVVDTVTGTTVVAFRREAPPGEPPPRSQAAGPRP